MFGECGVRHPLVLPCTWVCIYLLLSNIVVNIFDLVQNSENAKFTYYFFWFSEFSKNRSENFIDSNYTKYTQKIAKSIKWIFFQRINNYEMGKALSNGANPKLNFLVSRRISIVMSTFSVFGLSYGRSGNEFCTAL